MEFLKEPWPWYVAGPLIALTFFLLHWFGKTFGVSSNLRAMCTIGGAGKVATFFRIDPRSQAWNLTFILGSLIGGFIAFRYLMESPYVVDLAADSIQSLHKDGIQKPGKGFIPNGFLGQEALQHWTGWAVLSGGGFLVGFGARWAGGCTSGHAITGLSQLQVPSLIAVIGFFVGGLIMTHFLLPFFI
jgi:hypothetical protein